MNRKGWINVKNAALTGLPSRVCVTGCMYNCAGKLYHVYCGPIDRLAAKFHRGLELGDAGNPSINGLYVFFNRFEEKQSRIFIY